MSFRVKKRCRLATTANITLSGLQTIDGITTVANDRILVKDQTTPSENGIYVAASGAWTRATDFNNTSNIKTNDIVFINLGTVNRKQRFKMYSTVSTVDTDEITWSSKTRKSHTHLEVHDKLDVHSGLHITGDTKSEVTLSVKGVSSQTANLVDVKQSNNTTVMSVDKDGKLTTSSLEATTADINGGTIDDTDITVGSGKTLDVSDGTLTLKDDQISGDKIEGGTINATTINTLTSTTIQTTDIKSNNGTSSMTVADSSGIVTCNSDFIFKSYTTSNMIAISTPSAGTTVYNSDLNRLCFYNGTNWQLTGCPEQKTVLVETAGSYSLTTSFAQIHSDFTITFTALTPCYEIIFNGYAVSKIGYKDTYRAYDTGTSAILVGSNESYYQLSRGDSTYIVKLFTNLLTPGNSYTIEIQAKASSTATYPDIIGWGGTDATGRLAVKPIYNVTVL